MSDGSLIERYPNPDIARDKRTVTIAIVVLWFEVVISILGGIGFLVKAGEASGEKAEVLRFVAYMAFGGAALYIMLALFVQLKQATWAVWVAFVFSVLAVLGNLMQGNFIALGINVAFAFALASAAKALDRIKARVMYEDQEHPLTAYYHAMVPLIVRVLNADGKITSEEMAYFNKMAEQYQLSPIERKFLFDKAMASNEPISVLVARAMEAAQRVQIPDPAGHMMTALVGAAAADRVLAPQERQVLEKAALAAGLDPGLVQARLDALARSLGSVGMERQQALQVLGLPEGASPQDVEAAYQRAMAQTDPAYYAHMGQQVVDSVRAQREMLERARQVLMAGPPA